MEHQKKFKALLISGLFVSASPQIINRFVTMPDFLGGCLTGVGLGLMLTALFVRHQMNTTC